ncbi:MAG TPA: hypothetical protein VNW72_14330 [Chthoniobacterales bacterium]|jgi:hypothetical protein|nr:hypothetical protein [Chthoniobacterales bacterium]
MAQLPVDKARRIISIAFLGYTQSPIPTTDEADGINIKKTLEGMEDIDRKQVHRSIVTKTKAEGYQTSLADARFVDSTQFYDTVGDIVTDLIDSAS